MMLSEYFQIAPSPPPFCRASSDRQNSQAFYCCALITDHQNTKKAEQLAKSWKSSSFGNRSSQWNFNWGFSMQWDKPGWCIVQKFVGHLLQWHNFRVVLELTVLALVLTILALYVSYKNPIWHHVFGWGREGYTTYKRGQQVIWIWIEQVLKLVDHNIEF